MAQSSKTPIRGQNALSLPRAIAQLAKLYPPGPYLTDPLAILVWENVAYLIDDEKRGALFEEFSQRIGLGAHEIANAPLSVLGDIAKRSGMAPQQRAERLKEIGRLVIVACDGDLRSALASLPPSKARTLLKKFPSVGDPGADRILLFAGIAAVPSLDSNGLRALVRLGFSAEEKSYAQSYRRAVGVLAEQGVCDADWFRTAWLVLRAHGKALCKRSAPICEPCPLDRACVHRLTVAL